MVIKVSVDESPKRPGMEPKDLQDLKNKIIKECVDKVLIKLESLSER